MFFYNKKREKFFRISLLVPRAGIEPAWKWIHWCLRPARLPIPPSGLLRRKGKRFVWIVQIFFLKICFLFYNNLMQWALPFLIGR